VEGVLAQIWCEVLRLESVGVEDDFFDLGGHSLLATRVASRLCKALSVDLAVDAVFNYPRLCDLARKLEELSEFDTWLI
jgi:hypothetical protein